MSPWAALRAVVIFVYVFMLGPILITAAVSFNESNRSQFPPRGFSLQWWGRALSAEWVDPLWFSLKLGTITALISTLLALPLAFALARHRFPGRDAMVALTLGPLMLPALVTGVGLLQLFQYAGLREYIGFTALLVGHVVICLPFAVRTVAISLHTLPPNVELAAASLGASRWRCPPESSSGRRSARPRSWTRSSASLTRWPISSGAVFLIFKPKATFCPAVMCGKSA